MCVHMCGKFICKWERKCIGITGYSGPTIIFTCTYRPLRYTYTHSCVVSSNPKSSFSLSPPQTADDAHSMSSGGSPITSPSHSLVTRRMHHHHHHPQRVQASPPICVPEVQEKTHTKRYTAHMYS